jgi:hypothetical protein
MNWGFQWLFAGAEQIVRPNMIYYIWTKILHPKKILSVAETSLQNWQNYFTKNVSPL